MERTVQLKSVINSNGVDAVDGKGFVGWSCSEL